METLSISSGEVKVWEPTTEHGSPSEGMCCMVSYEDITDEDKVRGSEERSDEQRQRA